MDKQPKTLPETRKAILEMTFCTEETCEGLKLCFRAITNAEVDAYMKAGIRVSTFQQRRECFKPNQ